MSAFLSGNDLAYSFKSTSHPGTKINLSSYNELRRYFPCGLVIFKSHWNPLFFKDQTHLVFVPFSTNHS